MADAIRCAHCGETFDPAHLDAVVYHENVPHRPIAATGIVGAPEAEADVWVVLDVCDEPYMKAEEFVGVYGSELAAKNHAAGMVDGGEWIEHDGEWQIGKHGGWIAVRHCVVARSAIPVPRATEADRCDSRSPVSGLRCELPAGHAGYCTGTDDHTREWEAPTRG